MSPSTLQPRLLGTWTLETHTTSDLGYYQRRSWMVMHLVNDPLQAYACQLPGCSETENQACQNNNECLDTTKNIIEWSDVAAFFQYGIDIQDGALWKTHIVQNTSGWLGPYNWLLPQKSFVMQSRYVTTASTGYLVNPPNNTMFSETEFDRMAGTNAVQSSIVRQPTMLPGQDPYADYKDTCKNGDLEPVLPRLILSRNRFQLDFLMLSVPDPKGKDPLAKLWPSLGKRLPDFPVVGPYCYGNDARRAWAMNISYDSASNNTWSLTQGCVEGLPCWPNEHIKNNTIPNNNPMDDSTDVAILWTYACYLLLFGLVVSLAFNLRQSVKLSRLGAQMDEVRHRRRRARHGGTRSTRRVAPTTVQEDLEEPLLSERDEEEADPGDTSLMSAQDETVEVTEEAQETTDNGSND